MKSSKILSIFHISIAIISLLILMIPWYQLGINFPNFVAGGKIIIDSKYIVVGFLYIILFILKFWEYKVELINQNNWSVLFVLRNVCDKILLNGLLILLSYNGFISAVIPVIVISKDILVENMKKLSADNGKMIEKSLLGITEKTCMSLGLTLILFYNLPFELWNIFLADALIMISAVLSVLNGCLYYFRAKNLIMKSMYKSE